MATVTVELRGVSAVRELLVGAMERYPSAVREAVNHIVASTRLKEIAEITRVYNAPVPYTRRGVVYRPMRTDTDLDRARVALSGSASTGADEPGAGTIRYLPPTVEGRRRRHKPFEVAIINSTENARLNILSATDYLIPGPHAIYRDTNGNIKAAIHGKIAADLGVGGVAPTPPESRTFFLAKIAGIRGIWEKTLSRDGVFGRPLLVFVANPTAPQYGMMFDFPAVGEAHIEAVYRDYLNRAIDHALSV